MPKNYTTLARAIIIHLGGKSNILNVSISPSQLNFSLVDGEMIDFSALKALPEVIEVEYNPELGQYQLTFWKNIVDLYRVILKLLGLPDCLNTTVPIANEKETTESDFLVHLKSLMMSCFQVVLRTITESMAPIVGLLAAGGILNGFLNIFVKGNHILELISTSDSTYIILSTVAMAPFYFLPLLVGVSAAKHLAPKDPLLPYIGAAIGGSLIAPAIRNIVSLDQPAVIAVGEGARAIKTASEAIAAAGVTSQGATAVMTTDHEHWVVTAGSLFQILGQHGPVFNTSLFGIPMILPSYAYSILPIIIVIAVLKPINRWLKWVLSTALRPILQPLISYLFGTLLVFLVVGPIISTLSSGLVSLMNGLLGSGTNLIQLGLAAFIIGLFYQALVILGLHWLVIPFILLQLVTTGQSDINMIVSFTMLAQGTGALVIFFKTRHQEIKGLALPSAISAFMGITEPAIYGINLKYFRVFVMSAIGGAIGAASAGFMGLQMYGISGSLIGFPNFIRNSFTETSHPNNFAIFWIATLITFGVTFILVWLFAYNDYSKPNSSFTKKPAFKELPE